MLHSRRAGLLRRAGDESTVTEAEIGLEADQTGRLRQHCPRQFLDLGLLRDKVRLKASDVSLPVSIHLVAVPDGFRAA